MRENGGEERWHLIPFRLHKQEDHLSSPRTPFPAKSFPQILITTCVQFMEAGERKSPSLRGQRLVRFLSHKLASLL